MIQSPPRELHAAEYVLAWYIVPAMELPHLSLRLSSNPKPRFVLIVEKLWELTDIIHSTLGWEVRERFRHNVPCGGYCKIGWRLKHQFHNSVRVEIWMTEGARTMQLVTFITPSIYRSTEIKLSYVLVSSDNLLPPSKQAKASCGFLSPFYSLAWEDNFSQPSHFVS